MRIPKYIRDAINRRADHQVACQELDKIIGDFLNNNGIKISDLDIDQDADPYTNAKQVLTTISNLPEKEGKK